MGRCLDNSLSRSEKPMAIVSEGRIYDFTQVEFEISKFETSEKIWGRGKGGAPDEPFPIGKKTFSITEISFTDFDTYDPELVLELRSLKPGDVVSLDSSVLVEGELIEIKGDFPVLYTHIDQHRHDFFISTRVSIGVDKWD